MLPTFLVIGAMKSGTTSLHGYLAAHPHVFMAEPKELHFFSVGRNWERGRTWYEERFADADLARARGEASPSYSQADIFPGVAGRIAAMLPDVRIVYLVRHPIERMRSMYLHQLASGRERRPIADAFRSSAYYLNSSRYAWQLEHHLAYHPAERVRVLTTEALRDDPRTTMAELYEFIGVDPGIAPVAEVRRGRTDDKRVATALKAGASRMPGFAAVKRLVPDPLRAAVRTVTTRPVDPAMAELPVDLEAELVDRLWPDVARLRDFLGADFNGWGLLEAPT
jgi:Sulfotransferase domain